jgi:p-aminobenzoyl-glutamate transporter AbgT
MISGIIGFVFVLALLGLSYLDPYPNAYQLSTIRLVRALVGAAAFGGLAGTIKVEAKIKTFVIQATSAAGAFIVLYFFWK